MYVFMFEVIVPHPSIGIAPSVDLFPVRMPQRGVSVYFLRLRTILFAPCRRGGTALPLVVHGTDVMT